MLKSVVAITVIASSSNVENSGGDCTLLPGKACSGADIIDGGVVSSSSECCDKCKDIASCAAWTWNSQLDQHCWLKTSCNSMYDRSSVTSGTLSVSPPPTPPPTPAPVPVPSPQPTPDAKCTLLAGTACTGADIKDAGVVSSEAECCNKCADTSGCAAWTWNKNLDKHCWVKSECGDPYARSSVSSGTLGAAPPSPPPSPTPTRRRRRRTVPTPPPPGPSCGGSPPAKPTGALDLNGIAWPTMCVDKNEAHFFGIGDWGGDSSGGHTWVNPGKFDQRGGKVDGPDDYGQKYVARQMKAQAKLVDPDFVLNAGDNFYPGGVSLYCDTGGRDAGYDPTGQFVGIYDSIYSSPGLDGKPWFSVLGNHDYGGRGFHQGWDVQIFHTWNSDMWRMPGQYWSQTVNYTDFSIDIFMLDSNFLDTWPAGVEPNHNLCQGSTRSCYGINGSNCQSSFHAAWKKSVEMLEAGLKKSTATWKIVNTHFPGPSITGMSDIQSLHAKYGIDLVFTGHTHYQVHGTDHGINWIISGGGGGVSSDAKPAISGHDSAYGYVDFTVTKDSLKYDMHSWGGMDDGNVIIMDSKILRKGNTQHAGSIFV